MRDSSCLLRREETELAERAKPKQSEEAGYRRTFDSLWHGIGAEAVDRESERLTGVVDWRSIENADYAVGMKSLLFSLMSRESVYRGASTTGTIQKPPRRRLDDDEGSMCGETGEESAFHEPPEF